MFGVKTKVLKLTKKSVLKLMEGKLTNDVAIKNLMEVFKADTYGHRANINKANLGYGWIHYGLIRTINPSRVLCVGSRHGFIPALLAQGCKDNQKGYVDFVDPGYGLEGEDHWTGVGYWRTERGRECFKKFGLNDWITLYVMTTKEFSMKYKNNFFDYIYIDGDHSFKGVSLDYKLFWPRLRKGGFLALHDIDVKGKLPEGEYGVHKLWRKIAKKHTFNLPFKGSGLGLVQKGDD